MGISVSKEDVLTHLEGYIKEDWTLKEIGIKFPRTTMRDILTYYKKRLLSLLTGGYVPDGPTEVSIATRFCGSNPYLDNLLGYKYNPITRERISDPTPGIILRNEKMVFL